MPSNREINTCLRCRTLKVRCDRAKPRCTRCKHANLDCSLHQPISPDLDLSTSPSACSTRFNSNVSTPSTLPSDSVLVESPGSEEPAPRQTALSHRKAGNATKKRNRACLSCVRCHRLKVKCDKGQPCSRCRSSGFARQCEYTHRVEPNPDGIVASHSFLVSEATPARVLSAWKSHPRGSSHWRDLMTKVDYLAKLVSPVFFSVAAEITHVDYECQKDLNLPANYPFSSPGAARYAQLENVRALLFRHQCSWGRFVEEYCNVFHTVHPIINVSETQSMISMTSDELQSVEVSLLGEFCAILALGASTDTQKSELATELFLAAEACLAKTPFMVRPNLNTLRTMCLMLIAKQMANSTCWTVDGCWTLLGLISRQAASMGLQREPVAFHESGGNSYQQWKDGQILWLTILYFNLQVSTISGMPPFLPPEELVNMAELYPWMLEGLEPTEQIWNTIIRNSCQTLMKAMTSINSDRDKPTYEETLEYNAQIRRLMGLLDMYDIRPTLRITLDMFFRRVLLTLHRRYALDCEGPTRYPVSYWASLECSLAILVHHRDLGEGDLGPSGSDMISRFFMLDFYAAALTACIHLLRQDAPLADGMAIPPRQTIVETLEACAELWSKEQGKSICFRSACRMLESLLNLLTKQVLADA